MPGTSASTTLAAAGVEDHRVGRADLGHQRPGFVEQGQHARLSGMVRDSPAESGPVPPDQGGQAGLVALDRRDTQLSRPSAWYPGLRQATAYSE